MENIIEQENLVNQDVTFPVAYACYNKELQTRLDSTSGGAFTTLATYFLKEKDAVIFGAAFDRNCNVKHIRVDTLDFSESHLFKKQELYKCSREKTRRI